MVLELSLIIPAYNESKNISRIIKKASNVLDKLGYDYEIIVVNDGSKDDTYYQALNLTKNNDKIKVISYSYNVGKGYAIKIGFKHAHGKNVIFMDSDLEINPNKIGEYIKALENADIVIGSKKHPDSIVQVHPIRGFLSWSFNSLVKLLTGLNITDTQSGFKAMKKQPLEYIFSSLLVKRYAYDVELLSVANLHSLKIIEMPVEINLTKSRFKIKEIILMFKDLIGITYRLRIAKFYDEINIHQCRS